MDKLEHFVRIRTKQVEDSHFQYALRQFFSMQLRSFYKKPERETAMKKNGRTRSDTDWGIKESFIKLDLYEEDVLC